MAFYLTLDALDPATNVESRWFSGDVSSGAGPFVPSLIDATHDSQGTNRAGVSGSYGRIIPHGSDLYSVLFSNDTDRTVRVFQSTDGGATWASLDDASAPVSTNDTPAYYWDGADTIICAYKPNSGAGLQFQDFDLVAGTWGSVYGTGGPNRTICHFIYKRANNTIFALLSTGGFNQFSSNPSTLFAASYDIAGSSWNAEFDPGTGFSSLMGYPATFVKVAFVSNYMDCDGRIGAFFNLFSFTGTWNQRVFYQQFNTDDSLGAFNDFGKPSGTFSPAMGSCLVLTADDKLVLWIAQEDTTPGEANPYPTVYIGTPISNPTWTPNTAGIDDKTDNTLQVWSPGGGSFDGSKMIFVWAVTDPTGSVSGARLRRATSTNLADPTLGWTTDTIYDMTADGPSGFYPLSGATQILSLPSISRSLICGLSASCNNPPPGMIGVPYSHQLSSSRTATWTLISGSLPPGLSLDPATGIISGTPTGIGTSCFTIAVT